MTKKHKGETEYVIGIDGGASKSIAVLMTREGKIKKEIRSKAINYHTIGERGVRDHLRRVLLPPLRQYNVRAVALGVAGLDTKEDFVVYRRIVKTLIPRSIPFYISNDTKAALEDSCPDSKARLIVIAGTGSNVYGEHGRRAVRSGGWDFLVADEGSAYGMGLRGIRAAIRSYDGRGEKSQLLERLMCKNARVKNIPALVTKIFHVWHRTPNEFKRFIASFVLSVDEAALKGDKTARNIIREDGAEELFLGVRAVMKRLDMTRESVCVGYIGSNFKAPGLRDMLSRKIKKISPRARFVSKVHAARGAARLALKLLNGEVPSHRAKITKVWA